MKQLPLFFLLAVSLNAAKALEPRSHSGSDVKMPFSDNYRVNEYNRDLEAAIRNSRDKHGRDRMIVYTGFETIFKKFDNNNPQNHAPSDYRVPYGTGTQFISNLEDFPAKCIPNLTILSHGWGSSRTSGGKGLPIAENSENGFPVTGFYTDEEARVSEVRQSVDDYLKFHHDALVKRFKELNGREATEADLERLKQNTFARYNETSKANSATLADLEAKISKRDINFCDRCLIQIYSCNLDSQFVKQFAQTTGCQIVYGTGKVSAVITGHTSDGSPKATLTGYKSSDKKEENGKTKYVNMNTRDGNFVRVTPLKNAFGKTYSVIEENVGTPLKNSKGEAYGYTYDIFK